VQGPRLLPTKGLNLKAEVNIRESRHQICAQSEFTIPYPFYMGGL
jgi:hypothetical protein